MTTTTEKAITTTIGGWMQKEREPNEKQIERKMGGNVASLEMMSNVHILHI